MRKMITAALMGIAFLTAFAQNNAARDDIKIDNISIERQGEKVVLKFSLDARECHLKSNREIAIIPSLSAEGRKAEFEEFTLAGRNRYYYHLRNRDEKNANGYLVHLDSKKGEMKYTGSTAYEPWMDNSVLSIDYVSAGCCNAEAESERDVEIADVQIRPEKFIFETLYVEPATEALKRREMRGTAYIDFPVNRTEILADFRNNPAELAKISETIERVKGDKDLSITGISIKGFASPEGGFANNERLAKGRAYALTDYVRSLYSFPPEVKFSTSWVAEDWDGLRKLVAESTLRDKEAISALLKGSDKENLTKVRNSYPEEYDEISKVIFPRLRKSDYVVEYTVRNYESASEILEVMKVAPGKLSLNELFTAAKTLEPGTQEYNRVFETAVVLYPDNETANLNAAMAALQSGETDRAIKLLKKAGTGEEAQYARGIAAALSGNFEEARRILENSSVPQAKKALANLDLMKSLAEGKALVIRRQ